MEYGAPAQHTVLLCLRWLPLDHQQQRQEGINKPWTCPSIVTACRCHFMLLGHHNLR